MALSPFGLAFVTVGLIVFTILTYLFSGRMRSFLELALIFDIVIIINAFTLAFFPLPENTSFIINLLIPALGLVLMMFRYNKHIRGPYNQLNAVNQRILNDNDLSMTSPINLRKEGDLQEIKRQQDTIVEQIAVTIGEIKDKIQNVETLNSSMITRTSSMRSEVNDITNDVDQILQSASVLSENIIEMQDQMIDFLDKSESEFTKLSSLIQSADRISDQTNLVAVNAAIEASHSGNQSNFNTVAEGIQRLSNRTRENTDKLYQGVISMKRQINKEIENLSTQLNKLENTIMDLGNVSNRSSSFTHQQIIYTEELDNQITEITALSKEILTIVEKYKLD